MSEISVIRQLSKKGPSGFSDPVNIGSRSEFITGVRGTSNNNLEEQFIMGLDCDTYTWEVGEGATKYQIVDRYFYNGTEKARLAGGYYHMRIYNYGEIGIQLLSHYVYGDAIYLSGVQGDHTITADGKLILEDMETYSIEDSLDVTGSSNKINGSQTLYISQSSESGDSQYEELTHLNVVRRIDLSYIPVVPEGKTLQDIQEVGISSKIIYQLEEIDDNGIKKTRQRQIINNYL